MSSTTSLPRRRLGRARAATALAAVGALIMAAGLIGLIASPASATTEHCPGAYTKVDQASGSASGAWGSMTWGGTSLSYNINAGYSVTVCLKVSNDTSTQTVTGAGTMQTPPTGPQGQRQDISYVAYAVNVPPPTDVCPNIPGDQATVPAGLIVDNAGNCVSPPPPPPTDVCPNIPGNQATVPAGLIVDNAGNCVAPPPPPPPTDVCPNIPGDQATVPAGLIVDNAGNCVAPPPPPPPGPPTDVCPNIPGNQASVPDGYQLVDGDCVQIAGEETIVPKPKPDKKPTKAADEPTVKGVQVVAPPAAAPAAAAPTAVAAGLGSPTESPLQMIAQMLVAGGMLLLMAGAWIGLGRREFGTHEA